VKQDLRYNRDVNAVYIDVGWRRQRELERYGWSDEPEILATFDAAERSEWREFGSVDEAIAWGRERAIIVLVRLGGGENECYSAGERHVTRQLPEYGGTDLRPLPKWPPPGWGD
jgi:hypothetical protein